MSKRVFHTDLIYTDRETKQKWVSKKYRSILKGKILDVGADEGHILKYLPQDVIYKGVGLGGINPDIVKIDLEKENLPFVNNEFDCVMCLDVLEHLENIHSCFDEICRISAEWIIISLPNPYNDLLNYFRSGKYMNREKNMKFYGLPKEREVDRHKWFFSAIEAKEFISYRAYKNGFEVYDYYAEKDNSISDVLNMNVCFSSMDMDEIATGTMWWVLKKN